MSRGFTGGQPRLDRDLLNDLLDVALNLLLRTAQRAGLLALAISCGMWEGELSSLLPLDKGWHFDNTTDSLCKRPRLSCSHVAFELLLHRCIFG